MSLTQSRRIENGLSSPAIEHIVQQYRRDWGSSPQIRPDLRNYLPSDRQARGLAIAALARTDLALRKGTRDQRPLEWYRDQFPELDDELLVALLYEDYCLREEAGESPEAAEYASRFPSVAGSFQDVLAIHELVGRVPGSLSRGPGQPEVPFPEAGRTIAGFRLVEELGRGAFARVFLAEEQHLADRTVALKVSRAGTREPQTLARLQHTHIVPIHSYRTDPATGLHLLCMPYLGRITLLQILSQPEIGSLRSGAELLNLLDRLQPQGSVMAEQAASRRALEKRSYAQAISWWGARMAEALQHAHDRGVLHRDVKPSNVLVTGDGLPMLLDFNLAQEPRIDDAEAAPAAMGGTLAYMAPEHLEALVRGDSDKVDARSDLYALGVVLLDCLFRGKRPHALPSRSAIKSGGLLQAGASLRRELPGLRTTLPDVPAVLEVVVRRCLAPDPSDRYASAAELAIDLQAVADDAPLQIAREPLFYRITRWSRRNRRRIALAAIMIVTLVGSAYLLISSQLARLNLQAEVRKWLVEGRRSVAEGQLELGLSQFEYAERLAREDRRFHRLHEAIASEIRLATARRESRDHANRLFQAGERLRYSLSHSRAALQSACRAWDQELAWFSFPDAPDWTRQPNAELLDPSRHERLTSEANELLFLRLVVALDRDRPIDRADAQKALRLCDAAMAFAKPLAPWRALRQCCQAALDGEPASPTVALPTSDTPARGCFEWAFLCDLAGRLDDAVSWLEQATRLEPDNYWSQFYLAYFLERTGQNGQAMEHYQAAVALRPDSPWARYNRARLCLARGDWNQAADDLNRILSTSAEADLPEARLELGVVKQALGDDSGARAAYETVIARDKGGRHERAARLNRAKLDIDAGHLARGRAEYNALLDEDPRDASVRLSRAVLALRSGQPAQAESDLTLLLRDAPEYADDVLARRAAALLAMGRFEEARSDAASAYRRKPTASHERLWVRSLLALGRIDEISWLDEPDHLEILPAGGRSLQSDLRRALSRLASSTREPSKAIVSLPGIHRLRAVLLSALHDPAAEAEASCAIALLPNSAENYLVRARVRRRAGNQPRALQDVEAALLLLPDDPRLLELGGRLKAESGSPGAALVDFDRAIIRGARGTVWVPRAQALMALGRSEAAARDWARALEYDPEDPEAHNGRALALLRKGSLDQALAELEEAADWAGDRPWLLARITLTYARCLEFRPARLRRWMALAARTWSAWMVAPRPPRAG